MSAETKAKAMIARLEAIRRERNGPMPVIKHPPPSARKKHPNA